MNIETAVVVFAWIGLAAVAGTAAIGISAVAIKVSCFFVQWYAEAEGICFYTRLMLGLKWKCPKLDTSTLAIKLYEAYEDMKIERPAVAAALKARIANES